jgi:hypothetical protein
MSKPMDKDFEQQNFFGLGAENSAFAQYFDGVSYLNPLTKPGESDVFLANVTFEPGVVTTGIFTTPARAAVRFSFA